ncbi:hypothetical protein [Paraburkholderia ultramafica]|uniref:hypothetical protein n=1 Tax=Paraburkholderia ultramafica TaxID=1544867 RepID=UPI0015819022|nr:hypothetical protein [Paraburkholderia ultramafica]
MSKLSAPLGACEEAPDGAACRFILGQLKNPYFLGDEPGLTQTSGWVDAWTSKPSAYVVAAENSRDVAEAIKVGWDCGKSWG